MDAFTTVVACDKEHIAELRETWPTWTRFHPEILANQLLFLSDGSAEFSDGLAAYRDDCVHRITTADRPTQKDRMLASLLLDAPRLVTTPQWLKIDTDTIAVGPGKPLTHYLGVESLAAPAWPYTIPIDGLDKLDAWWKSTGEHAETPPLGPKGRKETDRDRVHLSRVIGWLTVIDTDFSRRVAELLTRYPPPFISHDTLLWYCAERWGIPAKPANFKRDGWEHHLGLRSIKRRVAEVMGSPQFFLEAPRTEMVDVSWKGDVAHITTPLTPLPPPAPPHSRVLAGVLDKHFGRDKPLVGVEIGVYRGETASHLLSVFPKLTLFMVDPWREYPESEHEALQNDRISCQAQAKHDECRKLAYDVTSPFRERRVIMEMGSIVASERVRNQLDFAFIDGRHDFEGVRHDISAWYCKVRSGGILAGHDYGHRRFKGVTQAVDEFVAANGLQLQTWRRKIWSVVKP